MQAFLIPAIITLIFLVGTLKKVDVLKEFTKGANDGILVAVKLIPILICVFLAISVFKASGSMEVVTFIFSPLTKLLHIPKEVSPLMIMRPISGSGSLALLSEILRRYGADTYLGRLAAVMTSSTETTMYTIAVYSEGAGIKKSGRAMITALFADIASVIFASIAVNMMFK